MDLAEAHAFLQQHHRAVLITLRADGRPQASPVVCALDAEGRVAISTREAAAKTRNARRDPRVALCVLKDSFFGGSLQVEGQAEVVSLPEAMEGLVEQYRAVAGEHPDWDDYRRAMNEQRRVLLRFAIDRAGPSSGG